MLSPLTVQQGETIPGIAHCVLIEYKQEAWQGLFPAFVVGGLICVIAQLIIELTPYSITPAHILVGYVVGGAVLSGIGCNQPWWISGWRRRYRSVIWYWSYVGAKGVFEAAG